MRNADNIKAAISFRLKYDIIAYRNDFYPRDLVGVSYKFTSTSVAPGAVIGKVPNVAIIVPRGSNGGYVEVIFLC